MCMADVFPSRICRGSDMQSLKPTREAELADLVRGANASGAGFDIVSGATKRSLGRAPHLAESVQTLDLSGFAGIVAYEPDELVITVQAGTKQADIEPVLAARNQMFGFAPADWGPFLGGARGMGTMAGIAASDCSGSRRVKAGAVRDHLIGCRFVNGTGQAVKAGGKVVKNVTGFDITKLMCGAFGTLGALTELTFRVTPKPSRASALVLRNCTQDDGLRALRQAGIMPVDPTGLAYLPQSMLARSAAAQTLGLAKDSGAAFIRVEGEREAVDDKLTRLAAHFPALQSMTAGDDETAAVFAEIGNGAPFAGLESDVWRLCVPPTHAPSALADAGARYWYADWAGGVLWLGLPANRDVEMRLRSITAKVTGHATLMRAAPEARAALSVFEPLSPAAAVLAANVKRAFDPGALFNRGRMYDEV